MIRKRSRSTHVGYTKSCDMKEAAKSVEISLCGASKKYVIAKSTLSGYVKKFLAALCCWKNVGKAFSLAFKINNVTAGFMLLEFIHSIESFLLTMISDWNIPMVEDSSKKDTLLKEDAIHTNSIENISLTSKIDLNSTFDIQSTSSLVETVVTPTQIRPFSKAPQDVDKEKIQQEYWPTLQLSKQLN